MTWNYRIVCYKLSGHFGLHEVFYDDQGQPVGMTARAIGFSCDKEEGPQAIISSLQSALRDAGGKPVLAEGDIVQAAMPSTMPSEYDGEAGK